MAADPARMRGFPVQLPADPAARATGPRRRGGESGAHAPFLVQLAADLLDALVGDRGKGLQHRGVEVTVA